MTHATGNAIWKNYPDTSTLIDAARLNNDETVLDNLHIREYGGVTRTRPALFRAYYTGSFAINGTIYVQTGWTVDIDTDNAWTVPGVGTASYYTIPYSGRFWDLQISFPTTTTPVDGAMTVKVMLNTANDQTAAIASDSRSTNGWEGNINCFRPCVPLVAGDKIYFSMWTSTSLTVSPTFGYWYPHIMVRDAGPV